MGEKCKEHARVFEQEKKTLEEKVARLLEKKNTLEQYIDDFYSKMNEKLTGKSSDRMKFICSRVSSTLDLCDDFSRQNTVPMRIWRLRESSVIWTHPG